jgi:hypothetical protein
MGTLKTANRYPRPGERIAPKTLKGILGEPIPKRLADQLGAAGLKLCDLDENVWRKYTPSVIGQLVRAVLASISSARALSAVSDIRFPRVPPGLRLDSLNLENRTRRCLIREGLDDQMERLGSYTLGDILSVRAFGPRSLLDLLTALEAVQIKSGRTRTLEAVSVKLSPELTNEAKKLAALPESRLAGRDDPRFGRWMNAIYSEGQTVFDMAEKLHSRKYDPLDVVNVLEHIRQLRLAIERMPQSTLEDELIQIFASLPSTRNREILIGYYGWEDGKTHTLTEIGDRFGITRERVRQICAKQIKRHPVSGSIWAPVMDRTLALIDKRIPEPAKILEAELIDTGLTTAGMTIQAVAAGAKLLHRPVKFKIVKVDEEKSLPGRKSKSKKRSKPREGKHGINRMEKGYMAVRPEQANAVPAIVDQIKKEIYFHGLTTVARIERSVARRYSADKQLIRRALYLIDGFRWLDEPAGWCTVQGISKHGLPKAIDKVLAVAGNISVSAMRTALARNRRLWKEPPPERVLLEYCRWMPDVRIEGDCVISDPPRNWKKVLTGVEAKLVSVLKKHGPLMDRGTMEDLCVAAGMNRFSFHAFVSWSPVIEQFAHSLYGLLGAQVSEEQVDKMLQHLRANRATQRVLGDHGVSEDGNIWLKYRLSKAASTYAVITIPAALKKLVRGRFQLHAPDKRQIGTLAAKDGRAWGLGAYLRKCGAKFGDQVALDIDLGSRAATVTWEKGTP